MIKKLATFVVGTSVSSLAALTAHADACPDYPPVARIESVKFYTDPHSSVVDMDKIRERNKLILPLRNFVTDASKRVDGTDHAEQECVQHMLLEWAAGKALEEEPADIAGQHDRQIFDISLNIIALKLQKEGFNIAPIVGWLGDLNRAVTSYFEKRNRLAAAAHRPGAGWAPVDNLYVWSGVNAASYAVLNADRGAKRYEDDVWHSAIEAIRPDGYLESELRRGGKALHYHAYDLSAILTMHAFREALGEPLTTSDRAAIDRLVERVGAGLCDPSAMSAAAGGFPQEKVIPLVIGTGFALEPEFATQQIHTCLSEIPTTDPLFGGKLDSTGGILAVLHRAP
jgi:poly(beta-D-mannuronate) lyase